MSRYCFRTELPEVTTNVDRPNGWLAGIEHAFAIVLMLLVTLIVSVIMVGFVSGILD